MNKYNTKPLNIASVSNKKVEIDFNGGEISSDTGILLLKEIENKFGFIKSMSKCIPDNRHRSYVEHPIYDLLSQRIFQICAGYEDANDSNTLRKDPILKTTCNRLPIEGKDLASQPTISRLENSISSITLYRMAKRLVDDFINTYIKSPEGILIDIDDTDYTTYGTQQLSLFNAYYKENCYLPLHIYEGNSGKLITTILRPGKKPAGEEIVLILKHLIRYIRKHWSKVGILIRGDSHFNTPKVHNFCDDNNIYFIIGQTSYPTLEKLSKKVLDKAKELHELEKRDIEIYGKIRYKSSSWSKARRVICKATVTGNGGSHNFIVTNLKTTTSKRLYEIVYATRGKMELYIKEHKTHLQSDRTSCNSFKANQFRLFLHSIAYNLLHTLRRIGLEGTEYASAQFDTIQKRLIKIGSRVCELSRKIKVHLPTSFPLKDLFYSICSKIESYST